MASGMKRDIRMMDDNERATLDILLDIAMMTDSEYLSFRERVLNALRTEDVPEETKHLIELTINICDKKRPNMDMYLVTSRRKRMAAKTTTPSFI